MAQAFPVSARLVLLSRTKAQAPIAESTSELRKPSTSRAESGRAADKHTFMTWMAPKELMQAHGSPAADFSPKASFSAIGPPISVARAEISTRPVAKTNPSVEDMMMVGDGMEHGY